MAFVPANNVLQVEMRALQFTKEVENTVYFLHTGAITGADVTALFNWIEGVFLVAMKPLQSTAFAWDEIYGTDLSTVTSPTYTRVLSPTIPGTRASPPMPLSVSSAVSFRSNGRGRASRGRNYASGLTEDAVVDDAVTSGIINALVAAYELMLGGGTFPAAWDWVVISRFLNGLPRVAALIQPIVDVLSTDFLVDSQRKRVK